jgi:Uma2 family endonuclease
MSTVTTQLMAADELLAMPADGYRYELVKGELRQMPPAGEEHGDAAMNIGSPLHQHVKANNLGRVYAAETGFLLQENPDTVMAPDTAFVSRERLNVVGNTRGYAKGAPDLAVEVVSPGDRVSEIEEKVRRWLEFGTRMVWVVSPRLRTVTVYRSLTDIVTLTEKDVLDGGDVVPGFRIAVSEIFSS